MKSTQIKKEANQKDYGNWLKCELHSHSHYSTGRTLVKEGFNSPEEMVVDAKRKGFNCIALTDHDLVKGNREAIKAGKKYDITVIPGEEVTTIGIDRKQRGHVLALGIQEKIKPQMKIEETIDKIHEQGGIAIAAHPFDISRRGIRNKASLCDAIEVFNAINIERIANPITNKFALKKGLNRVTGADAHSTDMLGFSYTMCNTKSNKDVDSILKAIKKGKTRLHCEYAPSSVLSDWALKRLRYSYDNAEKYIRSNYIYPQRLAALELLKLVKSNSRASGFLVRILGKAGIAGATGYGAIKVMLGL